MRKTIGLLLLLVSVGYASPASAQYERPGSTGAQFLKIGVSARGAAIGEAYIAAAEGAEAAHYNPANLGYMEGFDLALSHTNWFAGIDHQFVSAAYRTSLGTVAASVTALNTEVMTVRTPLQPEGTGETFRASSVRAGLSLARLLTDRVAFGGTVNLIHLGLYGGYAERALAVDIAASYVSDFRGFRFGMKIANLGSEVTFINESYPLPVNFSFGAGIDVIDAGNHEVMAHGSAMKPNDGKPLGSVGLEYSFNRLLNLRGGYALNHGAARYAFGAGLQLGLGSYGFRFDYGYSDFSLLGQAHRFSLGLHL